MQLLHIARRFSPVLAALTVAALLMLQPSDRAADHVATSPALSTITASGGGAAEMRTGHSPAISVLSAADGQLSTANVGDQAPMTATAHQVMGTMSSRTGMVSGCLVDCGSPASPSPGPMDCFAAGCLILLVLLVGLGCLRPASRGRGRSLPGPARRTLMESFVLRYWARPPLSLAELSISRT